MGLKGALYRKLKERQRRKKLEREIERKVKERRYGKIYAKEFEKKMDRDLKNRFKPSGSGSGVMGKLGAGFKEMRKRGFLKPDFEFMDRALHGTPLFETPRKKPKKKKKKGSRRSGKTVIIKL